MADTAIWSTFSWPRANILSARALSLVLVWLVLAFGLCFACSCDQNVRACLLVSSRRYFYKVVARVVEAEEPEWLRDAAERVKENRGAPMVVAQELVTTAAEAVVVEAAGAAEVVETTTTAGPRPLELAAIVAAAEAAMTETDAEEALMARSLGDAQREDRVRLRAVLEESKSVARAQSRSLVESLLAQAAAVTVTPEARLGAGARRLEAFYPPEGTHHAAGMGWREQVERNLEISPARHRLR